jgi:hypothetical protein
MDKQIFQKSKDKSEITIQKKQQKEKELIGQIFPYENHQIWEVDKETLEVRLAKYEVVKTFIIGQPFNKSILTTKGCAYISALNKKTALKKFLKGHNGSKPIDPSASLKMY